jgi:hypothetical protein
MRPGSSSESALRYAIEIAKKLGVTTEIFAGPNLALSGCAAFPTASSAIENPIHQDVMRVIKLHADVIATAGPS